MLAASGARFDQKYSDDYAVKAHERAIVLFRDAADKAHDADIKAFAQAALPGLEQHLAMGRALHASLTPTAAGAKH